MSQKLRAARIARGALELQSEEVGFQIEKTTRAPVEIQRHEEFEVNLLVEEMMILANESVAKRIFSTFPTVTLLRQHVIPDKRRFEQLIKCAEAAGIKLDTTSNKTLGTTLNAADIPGNPVGKEILKTLATRAMSEALYFLLWYL